MSKLFLLVKVNLLNGFKTSNKGKKSILPIFLFGYLGFCFYLMGKDLLPEFISLNMGSYFLLISFILINSMVLYFNLFKTKSILFDFKDYDLLMSLPIKKNIILASKLCSLYFWNLIYTAIIGIPTFINYVSLVDVSVSFCIIYLISLLFISFIPLVVSCIFGIIIARLMSYFRNKNIGNYIVNILVLGLAFFIGFKGSSIDNSKLATDSINLINSISLKYPLINIYSDMINNLSYLKLLYFILISTAVFSIVVIIIGLLYEGIRTRLLKTYNKDNYEIKKYNSNTTLGALFKKDFKKLINNAAYTINCLFGAIFSMILLLLLIIFKDDFINKLGSTDITNYIKIYGPLIIGFAMLLSSTTHPSISLEGKSFWIIKSLPIKIKDIFLSKILVNLSITIPVCIIDCLILAIYFKLNLTYILLQLLLPIGCSIFAATFGLLLNLLYPDLNYDNEIKVIKQGNAAFINVFGSMILGFIMFGFVIDGTDIINRMFMVTGIVYVVDLLVIFIITKFGNKLFKKI